MDAKTVCLAVLSQGEASGYEIRKSVEDGPFGHIQDIGFSSIYPALSRLREEGLVSVTELAQEGRPDKKIYRLTSDGRLSLLNALQEPTDSDRVRSDFLFRMLFAVILPPVLRYNEDHVGDKYERLCAAMGLGTAAQADAAATLFNSQADSQVSNAMKAMMTIHGVLTKTTSSASSRPSRISA